jgi:hypothetical protein
MKRALLLFALAACSSKSSTTNAPPPLRPDPTEGSGSAAGSSTDPVAEAGPGMGEKCGENDACAKGFECVSYYGIAGARGPQFKSCEIKCEMQNKESVCPKGTQCTTIADGPGQVCR